MTPSVKPVSVPAGFHTIIPVLTVKDVDRPIGFYTRVRGRAVCAFSDPMRKALCTRKSRSRAGRKVFPRSSLSEVRRRYIWRRIVGGFSLMKEVADA
jgi:hypothetical protein